ncbi:MAG: hypothetical protein ACYC3V_09255 [Chloroflexota bacterium]
MAPDRPFLDELQGELELWQRQGLVSGVQARRILAHYGLVPQAEEEARRTGRLAAIVGFLGAAFIFLGSLVFGGNVYLIAESYDVPAREPLLLALWSAGAFATAYADASRPALYLALLAAAAWYQMQLDAWRIGMLGAAGVVGPATFVPYGLLLLSLGDLQRPLALSLGLAQEDAG